MQDFTKTAFSLRFLHINVNIPPLELLLTSSNSSLKRRDVAHTRKFAISERCHEKPRLYHRHRSACGSRQSDQRLCCALPR